MSVLPLIFRLLTPSSRINPDLQQFLLERAAVLDWIQKQNFDPEHFSDVLIRRVLRANEKIQNAFMEEVQKLLQETQDSIGDPFLSLFELLDLPRSEAVVLCERLNETMRALDSLRLVW